MLIVKPRWKTIIEMIWGLLVIVVGSYLFGEAIDVYPFVIHDAISAAIGLGISMYGWFIAGRAWHEL